MTPDPRTGVCRFDPTKLSKHKRSKYAFRRFGETWLQDYRNRANSGDCSAEYVSLLEGYLKLHIYPKLGDISIYELDTVTIKEFYQGLFNGSRSKKHIQNIVDTLRMILKQACEDMPGLEMPKFPQYREKHKVKINKFLLEKDQDYVLSFVEEIHKPICMVYLFYGLRSQEVINLKLSDIIKTKDHEGNVYPAVRVRTLKGGPERIIILDQFVYEAIKPNKVIPINADMPLFTFRGEPYYRKTLYKIIRRALDKAGFKDFRPYDASRHSRASNMSLKGANAFEIQRELGHADIRTSQIYTHVNASGKWGRE